MIATRSMWPLSPWKVVSLKEVRCETQGTYQISETSYQKKKSKMSHSSFVNIDYLVNDNILYILG